MENKIGTIFYEENHSRLTPNIFIGSHINCFMETSSVANPQIPHYPPAGLDSYSLYLESVVFQMTLMEVAYSKTSCGIVQVMSEV